MDLSGHEGDLAGMPIPGPYGSSSGTAANFHDNKLRLLSTGSAPASGNGITLPPPHPPPLSVVAAPPAMASSDDHVGGAPTAAGGGGGGGKLKKPVRYRECLKNHAASIGGHALDGCGEFMPSGEEGTMEALKCAACDCHRNFHRREVEGEPLICDICHMNRRERNRRAAAIAAGVTQQQQSSSLAMPLAASSQQQPISSRGPMNLLALSSRPASAGGESDAEQLEASLGQQQQHHHHLAAMTTPLSMKKRFRTKFSIDQKERMYLFAEKVGWRIQKHDEAAVQQFCGDVGVKRHVLKVWMHNNKHTFGKRSMVLPPPSSPPPPPPSSSQQHSQQPQQQAIS